MEATTKVVTGKVRFSYAHVFEPKAINESSEPKYSVSLIIPKSDKVTIGKIKAAVELAKVQGKDSKFGGKVPANLKTPLRDGDVERPDDEVYENAYFINANGNRKPGIVDANKDEIMNKDEFYSGCYGRASVSFYPYNANNTSKGIACGLNHLQKLEEGEHLGGFTSAAEDFADEEDDLS